MEKLGLLDFPRPTVYNPGQSSSSSSSWPSSNRSSAAPYRRSPSEWAVLPLSNPESPTISSTTRFQCEARDDSQHHVGPDYSTSEPHRLVRTRGQHEQGQEGVRYCPKGSPRDRGGCDGKVPRVDSKKRSTCRPPVENINRNTLDSSKEVMEADVVEWMRNWNKGWKMSRDECRRQLSPLHCPEDMAEIGEGYCGKRSQVLSRKYNEECELSERRRRDLHWVSEGRGKEETSRSAKTACICLHEKRGAQSKADGDDPTRDVTSLKRYAGEGAKDRVMGRKRSARTVSSSNNAHMPQCRLENEDYDTRRTYESIEGQRRLTRASNHDDPGSRDARAEALEVRVYRILPTL